MPKNKTKAKDADEAAPAVKIPRGGQNSQNVPTDSVKVKSGFNPRSDLGDLTELKHSLKQHEMISPITVCPTKEGADTYYVIAGHRRFAAWKELNKPYIPVAIRNVDIDSDEALAIALSENSDDARTELSPVDQAAAFKKLLDNNGGDGNESVVAKLTGYSTAHVKRTLKLLDVPAAVRKRVESGEIGKLAAIATLDIPEEVRDRVVSKISAGTTEADVRKFATEAKREMREKDGGKNGTSSHKKTRTGRVSKHNVPVGQKAGDRAVMHGMREIRKQIERTAADALNAREEKDDDSYKAKANQLAALLWVVGSLDVADATSGAFRDLLKEIEERIVARMEAKEKAEAEQSEKSAKKTGKVIKSGRFSKSGRHTKSGKIVKTGRFAKAGAE